MNTRRVRAGGPPPCASSGCNGPLEGECMGLCTHRVNTHCMTKPVVAIKGRVEELPVQMHEPKRGVITTLRSYYRALERRLSKVAS